MRTESQLAQKKLPRPLMIADHPVLDFLNTVVMLDGERVDFFERDEDVTLWLQQAGFATTSLSAWKSGELIAKARLVREMLRETIERRKAGKPLALDSLNGYLAKSSSHLVLSQSRQDGLQLKRTWPKATAEQLLGPLVESAADLLTHGDFDLVRPCEDQTCILWFYDRTKSHHRRWCSTASCGNRFKVAAFRERQRAAKA